MPFPNEHAARQTEPDQYDSFARTEPRAWPRGASAIWGIKGRGKSAVYELQSIRFDRRLWTPERVRKWLRANKFNAEIEVATG